jgi:hypothetical protein
MRVTGGQLCICNICGMVKTWRRCWWQEADSDGIVGLINALGSCLAAGIVLPSSAAITAMVTRCVCGTSSQEFVSGSLDREDY